uniref:F-box/LRR-repeat protein 15/At3g58940/PEG3-like LRR domain-containing protein n=1 Tax=Aegilops tauschii TaxID=37682 RepID=N1R459_AEGTA
MPCFRRATSIELDTRHLRLKPPRAGELPLLDRLSLSGNIADLGTMLSRCPRLRVLRVTFREVDPDSLQAALASLETARGLGLVVSLLRINTITTISNTYNVGMISPQELVVTQGYHNFYDVELPCFRRTTAIEMCLCSVFTLPIAGEFAALERLSLGGCTMADLATLLTRCPRLRVLKATTDNHNAHDITVYSTSLQELFLDAKRHTECRSIDIVTPLLKKLVLEVEADTDLNLSISAPMVEEILLERTYTQLPLVFDFDTWLLDRLRLMT